MKKLLIFACACLMISTNSYAQYKPEAGAITTEIQFNPFSQSSTNFNLDGLKLRYFINEHNALRLKLGVNTFSDKLTDDREAEDFTSIYKQNSASFSLNLGYEYHINIAPRLSVYVGAGTGFEKLWASASYEEKMDKDRSSIEVSGSTKLPDNTTEIPEPEAGFNYQLNVFTGLDFYVYKGLYVGTELGFELNTFASGKVKVKTIVDKTSEEVTGETKATSISTKFYAVPNIRLGWRF